MTTNTTNNATKSVSLEYAEPRQGFLGYRQGQRPRRKTDQNQERFLFVVLAGCFCCFANGVAEILFSWTVQRSWSESVVRYLWVPRTHELSETRAFMNGFGKVLIPT